MKRLITLNIIVLLSLFFIVLIGNYSYPLPFNIAEVARHTDWLPSALIIAAIAACSIWFALSKVEKEYGFARKFLFFFASLNFFFFFFMTIVSADLFWKKKRAFEDRVEIEYKK